MCTACLSGSSTKSLQTRLSCADLTKPGDEQFRRSAEGEGALLPVRARSSS